MSENVTASPRWSSTTKLLVGLAMFGVAAFLLYRFSNLIVPLLMIFIVTYLLHPLTSALARGLHLPWKLAVNIVYLLIAALLIGLLTWGGVGLLGQAQSLVNAIQGIVRDLPRYVAQLSTQVLVIGPFEVDLRTVDLSAVSQQLLSLLQSLLGQTGALIGAIAGSAATTIGWTLFVLTVSYFVMSESSGLRENILKIDIPGYTADLRRLGDELSRIWNAFLRGQIIIFFLTLGIYSLLLPALGVRYAIGIAFLTALAKFLPYIGPAVTWIVMALVTYFQPFKPFGLQDNALTYMLIVVISALVIDWFMDNFITPRIMARTLRVHPAAVLIAALIAANLLGLLGVVIAAPFLATFLLLGRYVMRKMFDLDPWPETEEAPPPPTLGELIQRAFHPFNARLSKIKNLIKTKKEQSNEQQF